MSHTLYRKYRPQMFASVLGQQHIVKTLTQSLIHNRVGHAYLFTGPRGTGKTTTARLLAKAATCTNRQGAEPCLACPHCLAVAQNNSLDIIEIDAASNTGVDNIRELRDTIKLLPTLSYMKVYIIDEVHMLSIGAFNALLKTLEEPPSHVMFILATTSLHKVPDTIVSRCQKFDFTRLTVESIVQKLSNIAHDENVDVTPGAIHMIALAAEGGMRDAESLLMQIIHSGDKQITEDDITLQLGLSNHETVLHLLQKLLERNTVPALVIIHEVMQSGVDPYVYAHSLISTLRHILLIHIDASLIESLELALSPEHTSELTQLAQQFTQADILSLLTLFQKARNEVRSASIPQLPLEIAVTTFINVDKAPVPVQETSKNSTPTHTKTPPQSPVRTIAKAPKTKAGVQTEPQESDDAHASALSIDSIQKQWNAIVEETQTLNSALALNLRNCKPRSITSEGVIELAAKFPMYADKINTVENRLTVERAFDTILKTKTSVKAVVVQESAPEINPLVSDALNILGGEVVATS